MKTPEDIIASLAASGRVCPQPDRWNELWGMLPESRRVGNGWEPALPLILAAWHHTSDAEKRQRLRLHLDWAQTHGTLEAVVRFLDSLPSTDWHTEPSAT